VNGCDEFELLIEQRIRGVLGAADAARLDEHLAGCASCRDYLATATETAGGLADAAAAAGAAADWEALEQGVRAMVASYRRSVPRMAVALLLIVPVIWFAAGPEAGAGGAAVGLVILGAAWLMRRRAVGAALAAGRSRDDLLRHYREELDERVRRSRMAIVIELSVGPLLIGVVIARLLTAESGATPTRLLVFFAVWGAVLIATGIWRWRVGLPRVRAERDRFSGSEA